VTPAEGKVNAGLRVKGSARDRVGGLIKEDLASQLRAPLSSDELPSPTFFGRNGQRKRVTRPVRPRDGAEGDTSQKLAERD